MSFVFTLCRRNRLPIKGVVPETLEVLSAYPWPGNVRELENTLEKAILADPNDPVLYPIHLPPEIRLYRIRFLVDKKSNQDTSELEALEQSAPPALAFPDTLLPFREYRRCLIEDIEKHYLQRLLLETGGDIPQACTISGLSRSRLYDLLKAHGLTNAPDSRPE
jgi:two-component system NtrC family response regulator